MNIAAVADGLCFRVFYLLTHAQTGEEIARAATGMACFDYDAQKVVPIPKPLAAQLVDG